jgi:hypothetical protein
MSWLASATAAVAGSVVSGAGSPLRRIGHTRGQRAKVRATCVDASRPVRCLGELLPRAVRTLGAIVRLGQNRASLKLGVVAACCLLLRQELGTRLNPFL